eukprot:m.245251 g.245251  ORF g.245251 m.245251 type:complete len:119 (-) comp16107_c1_seq3:101-457(-)
MALSICALMADSLSKPPIPGAPPLLLLAPPPPPPPPPLPAVCGKMMLDTAAANDDVDHMITESAAACCNACVMNKKCVLWCWHTESGDKNDCHLHGNATTLRHDVPGRTTGIMNRTML